MLNSSILFSIILPTYNVSMHLERCLKALQNQTYKQFEMLFVDDCSTDNSLEIIERYKRNDSRIKIIRNKRNFGTYHARKKGVEVATGKYILFVDPDDEIEIKLLEKLAEHLANKNPSLVFFDIKYYPKKSIYQSVSQALPFDSENQVIRAVFDCKRKKYVAHSAGGKLFEKKTLIETYRALDIRESFRFIYSEDQLLYYAFLLQNPSYSVLDYKGYIYHYNEGSITSKNSLLEPQVLFEQQLYTQKKLKELVVNAKLGYAEKKTLCFIINNLIESELSFIRRYEEGGANYLFYTWKSFKALPSFRQFVRIALYLLSFTLIKR